MINIKEGKTFLEAYLKPASILVIFGGAILALQIQYGYFFVSALGLLGLLYSFKLEKERSIRLRKEKIREKWATDHKEKRDFTSIKKFYNFLKAKDYKSFSIDDMTWDDLNMDQVFKKLDHTESLPGMQYLYNLLRKPIFNRKLLEERSEKIDLFSKKRNLSTEIQYYLSLLGKKEFKGLFTYFEDGLKVETKFLILYKFFSIVPILGIVVLVFNRTYGLFLIILGVMVNGLIYQRHKDRVYSEIDVFKYIASLIKAAINLTNLETEELDINRKELREILDRTDKLYKNASSLKSAASIGFKSELEMLIDYINLITLRETIIFYETISLINKHRKDMLRIYEILGRVDAYIALASYKDSLTYFTEPELVKQDRFVLETEDLYHPLLKKPVPYSFKLDNKGVLVTGSNASGKSTYLRAIGINSLFAQTFYTALAKEYTSSYFKVMSSIGVTDNITDGDSYFMAESKSLKRIIEVVGGETPVLCILDEIFRGTNTIERISAATEVLNYMISRNTLVVAATHDIELTTLVSGRFNNYHFKESIEANDINFDYLLRSGPATTRNAIAILKYLGYPETIYENASKMAKVYEEKNVLTVD